MRREPAAGLLRGRIVSSSRACGRCLITRITCVRSTLGQGTAGQGQTVPLRPLRTADQKAHGCCGGHGLAVCAMTICAMTIRPQDGRWDGERTVEMGGDRPRSPERGPGT